MLISCIFIHNAPARSHRAFTPQEYAMISTRSDERVSWLKFIFQIKGSVIPAIFPRVLACCLFSLVISALYAQGVPIALPIESLIPSIVLGLLLVFRTNTSYERFWEGRKQWGAISNTARNLARQIWVSIATPSPEEQEKKLITTRLLIAYAVATKRHLRSESPINPEMENLMPKAWCERLQNTSNPPLEIIFWIGNYLQTQSDNNRLNPYQLSSMFKLLDVMVDALGACERILRTPIPLAYSIHLKQLILLYTLGLPFQMVGKLGWSTALVVGLVAFTVFGIEEIGIEIENPFGYDQNDLPLDRICQTLEKNIEDMIALAPEVQKLQGYPSLEKVDHGPALGPLDIDPV